MDMLALVLVIGLVAQDGRPGEAQARYEVARTLREPALRGPDFVLSLTPTPAFGGGSKVVGAYRSRAEPGVDMLRLEIIEDGQRTVAWARADSCPAIAAFLRDGPASITMTLPLARGDIPPAPMADGVILRLHVPFASIDGASTSIDLAGNMDSPIYGWWSRHEAALEACWKASDRP